MHVDRRGATRWRAVLLSALVLSQAGCLAGGWGRSREGKAALDQVRLKDPEAMPATPPPQDDLLRRYEAESAEKDGAPGPRPRPLTRQQRDREEVLDDLRDHFRKRADEPAPAEPAAP